MTPNEALSEIEFLASHKDSARSSELGRILREELTKLARIRTERDGSETTQDPTEPTELLDEFLGHIVPSSRVMAPFQWVGGKGKLAKKIIPLLPKANLYAEPYAGAASLLWRISEPYPIEVLNDLDRRIVNLFRVLQDRKQFEELAHRLVWTPYSRDEFRRALLILENWDQYEPVDRAWAFFVAQNQGFGGQAKNEGSWGRVLTTSARGMAKNTSSWRSRLACLSVWHDRLSRVQIDTIDALDFIRYWDSPNTLFYVDPPYVLSTRQGAVYAHEADDDHHRNLVELVLNLQGKVVLSGYDHPIYRPLEENGWSKIVIPTASHAAPRTRSSGLQGEGTVLAKVPRNEVIWLSFVPDDEIAKPLQKMFTESPPPSGVG